MLCCCPVLGTKRKKNSTNFITIVNTRANDVQDKSQVKSALRSQVDKKQLSFLAFIIVFFIHQNNADKCLVDNDLSCDVLDRDVLANST